MTSPIKKLQMRSWERKSKAQHFPREKFDELDATEVPRHFSKSPFKCKKNKGDHVWKILDSRDSIWSGKTWNYYVCTECDKKQTTTRTLKPAMRWKNIKMLFKK
jgi:hypothetical protein